MSLVTFSVGHFRAPQHRECWVAVGVREDATCVPCRLGAYVSPRALPPVRSPAEQPAHLGEETAWCRSRSCASASASRRGDVAFALRGCRFVRGASFGHALPTVGHMGRKNGAKVRSSAPGPCPEPLCGRSFRDTMWHDRAKLQVGQRGHKTGGPTPQAHAHAHACMLRRIRGQISPPPPPLECPGCSARGSDLVAVGHGGAE